MYFFQVCHLPFNFLIVFFKYSKKVLFRFKKKKRFLPGDHAYKVLHWSLLSEGRWWLLDNASSNLHGYALFIFDQKEQMQWIDQWDLYHSGIKSYIFLFTGVGLLLLIYHRAGKVHWKPQIQNDVQRHAASLFAQIRSEPCFFGGNSEQTHSPYLKFLLCPWAPYLLNTQFVEPVGMTASQAEPRGEPLC